MFAPEAGIGVPLAVAGFGFSVLVLGLANARVFSPNAIGLFVPVAMATGGFCLLIGGLFEFRANNTFAGTFAVLYAGFLLTTGLILRWFAGDITTVRARSRSATRSARGCCCGACSPCSSAWARGTSTCPRSWPSPYWRWPTSSSGSRTS